MNDCLDCPEDEVKRLLKTCSDEKGKANPSRPTAEQLEKTHDSKSIVSKEKDDTMGRLGIPLMDVGSLSWMITATDGSECMCGRCCSDDGSHESIVAVSFTEKAVSNGISRIEKICRTFVQVAMKPSVEAHSVSFTKILSPLRTIQSVSVGPLALENASFSVTDSELLDEDLFIPYSVLKNPWVCSRASLEQRRDVSDWADRPLVQH